MKKTIVRQQWQFVLLEYAAIAMVVLIPLFAPKGLLFAFTGMKLFLFAGISSVMMCIFAWGSWREKRALHITWLHGALAFFALALGLSAAFGVDPHTSWFGSLQHGVGVLYLYLFIVWAVLLGSLVRRDKTFLLRFLNAGFLTGVIVAITTYTNESGGPLGNNSYTGAYLLLVVSIGVGLLWWYQKIWQKIAIGGGIVAIVLSPIFLNTAVWRGTILSVVSIVGQAQGAAIGVVLSFVVMALLIAIRSNKAGVRWIGVVLFCTLLGGIWYGGHQFMTEGSALHTYVVEQKTANRFVFWDIARAGFRDHPFTGSGWGTYERIFQTYFDPVLFSPGHAIEPATMQAHNIVWEYLSTTGAFGFIAYIVLFCATVLTLYRTTRLGGGRMERIFGTVLIGGLAGYLLQNMFVFDTPVVYLIYFSMIGVALGMDTGWELKQQALSRIVSVCGVCGGIVGVVWLSVLPWAEASRWTQSITATSMHTTDSPQRISPVGTVGDTAYIAVKLYAKTQSQQLSPSQQTFFAEKLALFVTYLDQDIRHEPNNYKAFLVKGILENGLVTLSKKTDKDLLRAAQTDLLRAVELNPRTPEPYFNLVQTLVYEQKYAEAYAYLRAGITLAPLYSGGYTLADAMHKIAPNKDFERYISQIKAKPL